MNIEKSLAIVTFADLGRRQNLKTADIQSVIERFAHENILTQVICRMNGGFWFEHTSGAVPTLLHNFIYALARIPGVSFNVRFLEERIFDFFAKRELNKSDFVLFHYDYLAPDTIRKAKQSKAVTIGIAVTASVSFNAKIEEEELGFLGFPIGTDRTPPYTARLASARKESCDYIIACSEFARRTYIEAGFPSNYIFTAELDIDTERFSPSSQKKDDVFRVLYISHTSVIKGLHYLLEAWRGLRLENSELVIVGGYTNLPRALEKRYRDAIAEDDSIRSVAVTKKPEEFYKQASVVVLPSLTEGFGRVSIEAMACGVPVITTENAKGIVEDRVSGFVIPIRDANALKEKIQYFSKNEDARARMGAAARQAALRKPSFAESAYAIYEQIRKQKNK